MKFKTVQYLRHALQLISLIFFIFLFAALFHPLGWQATVLEWFSRLDPWALFSHLRWQHSIPVWGWLPLLTLVVTLLAGRVFCGWLCPFGALLMLVDKVSRTLFKARLFKKIRTKILHDSQFLRYYWFLFILVIFVLGSNWGLFLTPFALFSHEIVRILQGAIPWVLMTILVGTVFFSRLWCSVFCPTGILLSFIGRWRLFRYQVTGNCVQCAKCTVNCSVDAAPAVAGVAKEGCLACGNCQMVCPTKAIRWQSFFFGPKKGKTEIASGMADDTSTPSRRQFIKAGLTIAAGAALWEKIIFTAKGAAKKVLRPPGALPEADFISVCNRCGRCIKACSNNALRPMPITEGLEYFETPYIIPRRANCFLCFTCQEVCPTGAITQVPVEQVKMGTAKIDRERCIAWKENKVCVICGELCPVLAIEPDDQLRPIVQPDKCVGCGSCEKACPVDGVAAIVVLPK